AGRDEMQRETGNRQRETGKGKVETGHATTFPVSRFPWCYVLFLSLMLPLTVSSAKRRPPLPIVPVTRRGPSRPVTVSGKSVSMFPFTVLARTSVDTLAGSSSVIPPFTVWNSSASVHWARPTDAVIEPFTVEASALPDVETRML